MLWVADAPDAAGTVLLDPNGLSADGTTAPAATTRWPAHGVRHERRRLGLARLGRPRRRRIGTDLPDRVTWSKFVGSMDVRRRRLFYAYPEPPPDAAYDAPNRDMSCATTSSAPTRWTIRSSCRRRTSPSGASSLR